MTASPVVRKGKLLYGRTDKNISNLLCFGFMSNSLMVSQWVISFGANADF